jgi:hypothetical protein
MSHTRNVRKGVVLAFLLGALGCSGSDEPAVSNNTTAMSKALRTAHVIPKQLRANNYAEVAFKRKVQRENFDYQWYRGDDPIAGADGPRLQPEHFRRGDRISVKVSLRDGGDSYSTEPVEVLNSPPQILQASASITGAGPQAEIVAQVDGRDPDNDPIRYTYRWLKNAKLIPGASGQALPLTSIDRGDVVYAEVVASDDISQSTVFRTPVVSVENHPPRIMSEPGAPSGQMFVYEVQAEDEDYDRLSFELLAAPQGMTIDSSGRLEWQFPSGEERTGTHKVTVQVSDSRGGLATQTFTITF